jgi:hypothetical protein
VAGKEVPPHRHDTLSRVSSDEPTVVKSAFATRIATLALGKRVPEAEGLVPGARDDRLAIGAHREIQDATRVPRQRRDYVQRRVLPDADLVLGCGGRVAMGRDDLVRSARPREVTDL